MKTKIENMPNTFRQEVKEKLKRWKESRNVSGRREETRERRKDNFWINRREEKFRIYQTQLADGNTRAEGVNDEPIALLLLFIAGYWLCIRYLC